MKPVLALAVVVMLASATPASAQSRDRAVVITAAPIMVLPDANRVPLRVAAEGTSLVLLTEEGEWLRVQFQDPQFGLRTGYIQKMFVRIERASQQPTDLSVPTTNQPAQNRAQSSPGRRPAPPGKVFLDLNSMGFFPLQKLQTFAGTRTLFGEQARFSTTYPALPRWRGWDLSVAGSLSGSGTVGVAVRWLQAEYQLPVVLAVSIPHPTVANRLGTDVDVTVPRLVRRENMVDFHVVYGRNTPQWRAVVFTGPTYFRLRQEMVEMIRYSQAANPVSGVNLVNITTFTQADIAKSTWGINVGGDVAWFFSRYVGVGCGVRFNYGTVKIVEPLTAQPADVRVGGTTLVGGGRFRF